MGAGNGGTEHGVTRDAERGVDRARAHAVAGHGGEDDPRPGEYQAGELRLGQAAQRLPTGDARVTGEDDEFGVEHGDDPGEAGGQPYGELGEELPVRVGGGRPAYGLGG